MTWIHLGGTTNGTMSPVPGVGHIPGSSTLTRRSYVECGMVSHLKAPLTPQYVSHMHLAATAVIPYHGNPPSHVQASAQLQQPRPDSSNTVASDRISLESGSDQFSMQSVGPGPTSQSVFFVCPQSAACSRRSQVIQPDFYRQDRNSMSSLSATGVASFYLCAYPHRIVLFILDFRLFIVNLAFHLNCQACLKSFVIYRLHSGQ